VSETISVALGSTYGALIAKKLLMYLNNVYSRVIDMNILEYSSNLADSCLKSYGAAQKLGNAMLAEDLGKAKEKNH
jgi:hypothetical protein